MKHYDVDDIAENEVYICEECGEECSIFEETFDYSGTHCTNGEGGTHKTGGWYSECCYSRFYYK